MSLWEPKRIEELLTLASRCNPIHIKTADFVGRTSVRRQATKMSKI